MVSPSSIHECIPVFERMFHELELVASEAAVHTKKTEFMLFQINHFLIALSQHNTEMPLTDEQNASFRQCCEIFDELKQMICQLQIHCWAQHTLESETSEIASELCCISERLRIASSVLDKEASLYFDENSPKWLTLHILDLHAIEISFQKYIEGENTDPHIVELMGLRLKSVHAFLDKYGNEGSIPNIRVFSPIPVHYQSWRLQHSDFEKIKEVGQGVSSIVYYGVLKKTGQEVAIKELKYSKLTGSKLQSFQREISVLATSSHPTLLSFLGATDTPPYSILTEWMPNGNLYQELHKYKRLSPTMRTIAAFDIARGMQFLHSRHILHRDLKSLNVLLDSSNYCHICDFGFSRKETSEDDVMTKHIGTPHWMAPEVLNYSDFYTNKIDVYSYGILLWELSSGCLPFFGMEPAQVITAVLVHDLRPAIPMSLSKPLNDLIKHCWDKDPEMRPSFDEIVRRFTTGEVLLPGADRADFLRYVGEKIGEESFNSQTIERQLETEINDTQTLTDLVETIETEGMPTELTLRCFEMVEKCQNCDPKVMGRALILFMKTPLKNQAASNMRRLPPNSISIKSMSNIVEMIPSGSDEFDSDVVITACKNGTADYCVVYAIQPKHLQLALEVVARQGVDMALKAAVADKCVQCLTSANNGLISSAVRCLVGIGEVRRLTASLFQQYLFTADKGLHNCLCIAGAMLISEGHMLPKSVMPELVNKAESDELSLALLVKACMEMEEVSQMVLDLIMVREKKMEPCAMGRVLLAMARHKSLAEKVKSLAGDIPITNSQDLSEAKAAIFSL